MSENEHTIENLQVELQSTTGSSSMELLQKILDTIPQNVFWKDTDLRFLGCNQLFAKNAGKSNPSEVVGLSDFDMPWTKEEAKFFRMCDRRVMDSGIPELGIIEAQSNEEGERMWMETNKVPLHNNEGEVIGVLGTYHDISRLKQAEEKLQRSNEELERRVAERTRELEFVAHHDGLTGLANRIHFLQKLNEVLDSDEDEELALMFIDLDNFKTINDKEGHEAGDQLLTEVANILRTAIGPRDFAGRLGGDEFLLLLRDFPSSDQPRKIHERIHRLFRSNVVVNGQHKIVTASFGILQCLSSQYTSSDDMINDADLAMYSAKNSGKNNHAYFDTSMRKSSELAFNVHKQVVNGVSQGEFVLHYQPIVNINQSRTTGFESLVRWQHPERGLLYPLDFISIAEATGVIVPLGQQILNLACKQLAAWQEELGELPEDFLMHINLSPRQLFETGFIETTRQAVREASVDPKHICLEITETLLLQDSQAAIALLRTIREDGFHIALDDFGTGYSSLNYLDEFPVDTLKVDRSFVNKLDRGDNAIVRMIFALADTLNVGVIAEGIENEQQIEILKSMNCSLVQGYYFAKPMPADVATHYLIEHKHAKAPTPPRRLTPFG